MGGSSTWGTRCQSDDFGGPATLARQVARVRCYRAARSDLVLLMSSHPIFDAIVTSRYSQGLAHFEQLTCPSPEDERWAGYCLFSLGRLLEAKDLLLRAKTRGCTAATLELITVLRTLGDAAAAAAEADALALDDLAPTDRAYALREVAALKLHAGDLDAARVLLERAWQALGGDLSTSPLMPQTAQLLGYTYHRLGRDTPARHYLNVALKHAVGAKRVQPLLSLAQVHLYAGRYDEVSADLGDIDALLPDAPGVQAYHAYLCGLLSRAFGRWSEAADHFRRASQVARSNGESSTEFTAELGLASVMTASGEVADARPHLLRASRLAGTPWDHAMMTLRDGYWQAAAGEPGAKTTLLRARAAFDALRLPRETAWADLHLAEVDAAHDQAAALKTFSQAYAQRDVLEGSAALLPELRLLPRLTALLASRCDDPDVRAFLAERRAVCATQPLEVRLVTLGRGRLLADGIEVKFRLRRTVEVITFLLMVGPARRDDILAALWPDDPPIKAKSYFHQVVFALKEAAPYLRISYDRQSKRYALACDGLAFTWDVGVIKRLVSAGVENEWHRAVTLYRDVFLEDVDAEWAREERDALTFLMIDVGLKLMCRWSAEGEYDKCFSLARRLLEIDPCDATLVEFLVEATYQLEGKLAARRTLFEAANRATHELGSSPDWLGRLNQHVQDLN